MRNPFASKLIELLGQENMGLASFLEWFRFGDRVAPNPDMSSDVASATFSRTLSRAEWYREIDLADTEADTIQTALQEAGIKVQPIWLDRDELSDFIDRFSGVVPRADAASLPEDIAAIRDVLRTEKFIEFYLSAKAVDLRPDDVVVDIGSAESGFVATLVYEHPSVQAHAVDPSLAGLVPASGRIHYHPDVISRAAVALPAVAVMSLHCAFEMFEPREMRAVIDTAKTKLRPGGALIISPLYMRSQRTIYVDSDRTPVPSRLGFGGHQASVVGVKDYWGLAWSEWLSPQALRDRLATDLGDLDFTVLRVMNPHVILPGCFIRFAGLWRRA